MSIAIQVGADIVNNTSNDIATVAITVMIISNNNKIDLIN